MHDKPGRITGVESEPVGKVLLDYVLCVLISCSLTFTLFLCQFSWSSFFKQAGEWLMIMIFALKTRKLWRAYTCMIRTVQ